MSNSCVVIGSSHAAIQLCVSLRQQGWTDDIVVLTKDSHLPYHRPPLSKGLLAEDKSLDDFLLKPAEAYEKAQIDLRLDTAVTAIDRENKQVTVESGEVFNYSKLALCTGAEANRVNVAGSDLSGVYYLRDANDALIVKREMAAAKKAVIVGAGFIGLEIAASMAKQGIEVTVLEAQERILARVVSPEVSTFMSELHHENGVIIETNTMLASIEGQDSVQSVKCVDGRSIPADIVIVGIGVHPNVSLAENCGLEVGNGICINEFAQTSDRDIVAAGDGTNFYHAIYKTSMRLESVQNAMEQAKAAAASICGKELAFNAFVPRFWSDQYDVKLQICGDLSSYDDVKIDQDFGARKLNVLYLKDGLPMGGVAVNNPKFLMGVQQAIKTQQPLDFSAAIGA